MSADHKGPLNGKNKLSALLDFGPEEVAVVPVSPQENSSFTDRLKQIVKKLQEINERIDQLSSRF